MEDLRGCALRVENLRVGHADHLGTPRAITRPNDNKAVWKWDNTEPFGANGRNENPSDLGNLEYNLGFPGQYCDKETNTCYNYFRDNYIPALGRYGQSDPIGLAAGLSTYAYVGGNPLAYLDRFGLESTRKYVNLSGGWKGGIDMIPGTGKFEIHVFDHKGTEVGMYGEKGWFNKHGHKGRPKDCPPQVENDLKGQAIDILRRNGTIKPKGQQNIKGNSWMKGAGTLGAASSLLHLFTLDECTSGTTAQCFCSLNAEMTESTPEAAGCKPLPGA